MRVCICSTKIPFSYGGAEILDVLRPYGEVMSAALLYLKEAASLAENASFTVPASCLPENGASSEDS